MAGNSLLKKTPIWCPGCGLYLLNSLLAKTFQNLGWNKTNTVILSGIGCSGRTSGYYDLDAIHTTHGRAIAVAEGIKVSNPDLNVVVFSGDGDLLGIGGNHLLHSSHRGLNINVICNRNDIYGMTGGQSSPTTPLDWATKTHNKKIPKYPINSFDIFRDLPRFYYARASTLNVANLSKVLSDGLKFEGFTYIEVLSPCVTEIGRLNKNEDVKAAIDYYRNFVTKRQEKKDDLYIEFVEVRNGTK